jgi:hypothetical protein
MARRAATSIVNMAFEKAKVRIAIALIQPLKLVSAAIKKTPKYAQIAASIREVGIVEPPVVAHDRSEPGKYLLLDGHLRIDVLKDMGQTDVICLVSTDDEAFTYNKRVNRLAMIQEHRMILKAVERGVPELQGPLTSMFTALCESGGFWRESARRLPTSSRTNIWESMHSPNCGKWCPYDRSRPRS